MRIGPLAALFALSVSGTMAAPLEKGPFDGWSQERLDEHRNRGRTKIINRMQRWLTARQGLVFTCQRCQGQGRVVVQEVGRNATSRVVTCPGCQGSGAGVSREKFLTVFWDFLSPAYRNSPDNMAAVEAAYQSSVGRPDPRALNMIDGWRRKDIDVRGNYALAFFAERHDRRWVDRYLVWLDVDGDWWIGTPQSDADFPFADYPGPAVAPVAGSPPGGPEPAVPEAPPAPVEPPASLELGPARVVHVEDEVWKVCGRVTNRDPARRCTDIVVSVTLLKGDEIVDTASCPAQTMFLGPGESATWEGYVYSAKPPQYDRAEARVVQFRMLDGPPAAGGVSGAPAKAAPPAPGGKPPACPACHGSGLLPLSFEKMLAGEMDPCPYCEGRGTLKPAVTPLAAERLIEEARAGRLPSAGTPVWVTGTVVSSRRTSTEAGVVELRGAEGRGVLVCEVPLHRGTMDRIERLLEGDKVSVLALGIDEGRSTPSSGRLYLVRACLLTR